MFRSENHRPYCQKIHKECAAMECEHFKSRRPMTEYERTCMLCYDAEIDPYVYDWCEKFKKRVPVITVDLFKGDV